MKRKWYWVKLLGSAVLALLGVVLSAYSLGRIFAGDQSIWWIVNGMIGLVVFVFAFTLELKIAIREQRRLQREHYLQLRKLHERIGNVTRQYARSEGDGDELD